MPHWGGDAVIGQTPDGSVLAHLARAGYCRAMRRATAWKLTTCLVCTLSTTVWADGLDGQRFAPAIGAAGGFAVERAAVPEHLGWGLGLFLHYADDAVVHPGENRALDSALTLDLLGSIGLFDRFEIGFHLPAHLVYEGSGLDTGTATASPSTGVGDLRVMPKVVLWRGGKLSLGAALPVSLPTGNALAMRGADGITVEPRLLAGVTGDRWQAHVNLGFRWFSADAPTGLAGGDELTFGVSGTYALARDRLDVHAEIIGGWRVGEEGDVPLELLAGLIWKPTPALAFHAGGAIGVTDGLGTPDFRVIGGVRLAVMYKKDRDKDGVPDGRDRCPDEPEDRDGFEDSDGCVELDNDGDRIPDELDECPDYPEEEGGNGDGCPDKNAVVVQNGKLLVLSKVLFETNSAQIKPESTVLLDDIADALKDYPQMKVHIEGHTDDVGDEDVNRTLSVERATSVRAALIERGILPDRLAVAGHGETRPIAPNETPAGRAKNRRVEFLMD
jgi:outer membrane protein OmpA-like peptidoglycan-associated protein